MRKFNCAIVGASGMVGRMFAQILEERGLPVDNLYLYASARSAGNKISFNGREHIIEELTPAVFGRPTDVALFGVEEEISLKYAPIAAAKGCVVVDNSTAWRMNPDVPLVVPEVNGDDVSWHKGIIANPNCCAAPAVVALSPLHKAYGVKRVVYSTYQSVSGAGVNGSDDLTRTLNGEAPKHFPYAIAHNVIPHIGGFHEDGYTGEERKLVQETRKMLHAPGIKGTATTVRVPVFVGHSISINVTFNNAFEMEDVKNLLKNAPGLKFIDDTARNLYPMPLAAAGTDLVYAGRARRDDSCENTLNLWVVADNVRKGAATNAVQIAEMII